MRSPLSLLLLVIYACSLEQVQARNPYLDRAIRSTSTTTTSTTTSAPTSSIEDPDNSATSESSDDDTLCMRCYEFVNSAQGLIATQMALVKKQQKLTGQKQMAATTGLTASNSTRNRPRSQDYTYQNDHGSSNNGNRPIVVSTLRVARSTDRLDLEQDNGARRSNGSKNQRDPALKQLKHKQEQQLNETCQSLYEVQKCLKSISQECHGDLQFHSHEVFLKQWLGKLNCPPMENPGFRLFSELTRSLPKTDREKEPVPRPITSQEETQKRLDAFFGGAGFRPPGVMLKPTLTGLASQKFNSMVEHQSAEGPSKWRNILTGNEILGKDGSRQSASHLVGATTSQLLLIPCFLVFLMVVVGFSLNRHLQQTPHQ